MKRIRIFLGYADFYHIFIKEFSKIANPLFKLMEKKVKFILDEACLKTFKCLKENLISTPIIVSPNLNMLFMVMCVSSFMGIGEVLGQR